jgi:hypothetical protein
MPFFIVSVVTSLKFNAIQNTLRIFLCINSLFQKLSLSFISVDRFDNTVMQRVNAYVYKYEYTLQVLQNLSPLLFSAMHTGQKCSSRYCNIRLATFHIMSKIVCTYVRLTLLLKRAADKLVNYHWWKAEPELILCLACLTWRDGRCTPPPLSSSRTPGTGGTLLWSSLNTNQYNRAGIFKIVNKRTGFGWRPCM